MNKIITAGCVAVAAFAAVAMPNKGELADAKPLVEAKTKADLAAYKAGEKTAQKVALAHLVLAQKTESQAEKYLLCQGAFKLYARSGGYDLAADAIQIMKREVKDVPPEVIAELVGDELRYVADDKAPRLVALLNEAKRTIAQEENTRKVSKVDYQAKTLKQVRKDLAHLFPGWSLDTEVQHLNIESADSGLHACHRGQNNVICLHPVGEGKSAILSRSVTLSDKNPCLFLKVASAGIEDGDFLLSVRVNGKHTLSNRRICTPDESPWEDVTVPLSAWRGKNVKIEVLLTANGWWYEFPYLARLEIVEGNGESKTTVGGYSWSYRVDNGKAEVFAVSPSPKGHVVIPSALNGQKVICIGNGAFAGCGEMSSVDIPTTVTTIRSGAFSWYCGVKSVAIPSSVTNIEQGAFIDCKQIESFHVDAANPAYCSKKGLLCSKDGSRLIAGVNGDVTIPEGVKDIGADAFHGCFGLRTATIPSTVTNIELRAFSWIGEQASVCVDERNQYYKSVNGLLLTKDGTTLVHGAKGDVTIPNGVKTIGDTAFCSCGTESVTIPESVDTIERAAFFDCGLKTLTIPSGVRNMGINAFQSCGELISLTMLGELPHAPLPIFPGCDKLTAIHVPANAKSWAGMKEWQGKPLVFDAKTDPAK